ncbi:hypothetical protein EMCRGX_G018055 [Ephydatia muelleri]
MPFGISSAPEEFQRRLQAALYDLEGVAVVADNVLVVGKGDTMEEARHNHDEALIQLLVRARKANIKFNKDKMRLLMSELLYIGHRISGDGVRPDPSKVLAIQNMATPKSTSEVRRFLGMCNYLARFIPNLSWASESLRHLTEGNVEFAWGPDEQTAFSNIKDQISSDQLLAFYDVKKPVVIQCDASTEGLGATLLQEGRPMASASRSLTKSEKNYVAIELECLAIVFACRKFDHYIYGKRTKVETDHKPLEVITKKSLLSAPRRLQRMLLALQRYDLDVIYKPGEQQVIADTLSRLPAEQPQAEELSPQEIFQIASMQEEAQELEGIEEREFVRVKDQRLEEVKKAAATDPEQLALSQMIGRVVFEKCHPWPGRHPAQAKQSLLVHEIPKEPWGKEGMDLFCCRGKDYLVVINYLTDFFEVAELPNTLASAVVNATKQQFARHDCPHGWWAPVHVQGVPVPLKEVCQAPASEQLLPGESRSVPPEGAAPSSPAQSQASPIVQEAELEKEIPKGNTVTSAVQTRSTASVLPASPGVTTTTRCGRLVRKPARYQDFIEH